MQCLCAAACCEEEGPKCPVQCGNDLLPQEVSVLCLCVCVVLVLCCACVCVLCLCVCCACVCVVHV